MAAEITDPVVYGPAVAGALGGLAWLREYIRGIKADRAADKREGVADGSLTAVIKELRQENSEKDARTKSAILFLEAEIERLKARVTKSETREDECERNLTRIREQMRAFWSMHGKRAKELGLPLPIEIFKALQDREADRDGDQTHNEAQP